MLVAESKVATVKVSLPHMELRAALLLAKLLHLINTHESGLHVNATYAWTDSRVILAWITSLPHLRKTFVANQVGKIQDYTAPEGWHHIP